jgi:hypothetical protein
MDHINKAACIDYIEKRVIKTKRGLVFGVAVIFLGISECLDLH